MLNYGFEVVSAYFRMKRISKWGNEETIYLAVKYFVYWQALWLSLLTFPLLYFVENELFRHFGNTVLLLLDILNPLNILAATLAAIFSVVIGIVFYRMRVPIVFRNMLRRRSAFTHNAEKY
jgi:hypothetical protein